MPEFPVEIFYHSTFSVRIPYHAATLAELITKPAVINLAMQVCGLEPVVVDGKVLIEVPPYGPHDQLELARDLAAVANAHFDYVYGRYCKVVGSNTYKKRRPDAAMLPRPAPLATQDACDANALFAAARQRIEDARAYEQQRVAAQAIVDA